jgi:hypothetical protein
VRLARTISTLITAHVKEADSRYRAVKNRDARGPPGLHGCNRERVVLKDEKRSGALPATLASNAAKTFCLFGMTRLYRVLIHCCLKEKL